MIKTIATTMLSPWVALVGLGMNIFRYFDGGMPWRGEALWSAEWIGGSVFIWGPLLAAAAAFDFGNLRRADRIELVHSMDLGRRMPIVIWLAGAIPSALVIAVSAIPYATRVVWASNGDVVQFTVQLLIEAAVMSTLAAVGLLAGALLGNKLGPPVALGMAVGMAWGSTSGMFSPFDLGASTGSLLGVAVPVVYVAWQSASLLLVMVGLLTAVMMRYSSTGRVLIGAIVVALLVGYLLVPAVGPRRYERQAAVMAQDCVVGSSVRICVYIQHRRFLEPLVSATLPVYESARKAGVDNLLPKEFAEKLPADGVAPRGAGQWLPKREMFTTNVTPRSDVVAQLVLPQWCPGLYARNPPAPVFWSNVASAERALSIIASNTGDAAAAAAKDFKAVWPRLNSCEGAT